MRDDILVTGGSDGSVRVWDLAKYQIVHRLAAHDNSVTSLQFDDTRIVSGGSDGRVKVWDLKSGAHVRELCQPADAVWRVVFEEGKAVIMANRGGKTVMEVWNFSPPPEEESPFYDDGAGFDLYSGSGSPVSMDGHSFRESFVFPPSSSEVKAEDDDIAMTDAPEPDQVAKKGQAAG
jgi:F-box and WD-40 domain protein CDC4